jgi:hypothetical protein
MQNKDTAALPSCSFTVSQLYDMGNVYKLHGRFKGQDVQLYKGAARTALGSGRIAIPSTA